MMKTMPLVRQATLSFKRLEFIEANLGSRTRLLEVYLCHLVPVQRQQSLADEHG
jgi:hypothetical protein